MGSRTDAGSVDAASLDASVDASDDAASDASDDAASDASDDAASDGGLPVRAFPGAEGFGANTQGGRGGVVLEVTNLNASGPGSFRAACEASGPRVVVFRTGGTIDLGGTVVWIYNPFLTIAGQTAPGDGIEIVGGAIGIETHDVIVRGLRIRWGDGPGPTGDARHAITFSTYQTDDVHDIIVDHCSVSWATDELITSWKEEPTSATQDLHDITVQWTILSETLHESIHPDGPHSRAMLVGDYTRRMSIHHNLFAHNSRRNPEIKMSLGVEVINNLVYNWGESGTSMGGEAGAAPSFINIIGNYFRAGPDSNVREAIWFYESPWQHAPSSRVFIDGNLLDTTEGVAAQMANLTDYRSETPVAPESGISVETAAVARDRVLASVGAIHPHRDAVDERVVTDVQNRSGRIINSQGDVGGFPAADVGVAPTDSDQDGMPDMWEERRGLNPSDASDGARFGPGGYTNLEDFLNSFFANN